MKESCKDEMILFSDISKSKTIMKESCKDEIILFSDNCEGKTIMKESCKDEIILFSDNCEGKTIMKESCKDETHFIVPDIIPKARPLWKSHAKMRWFYFQIILKQDYHERIMIAKMRWFHFSRYMPMIYNINKGPATKNDPAPWMYKPYISYIVV